MDAGGPQDRARQLLAEISGQAPDRALSLLRSTVYGHQERVEMARRDLEEVTRDLPAGLRLQEARANLSGARQQVEIRQAELVARDAGRMVVAYEAEPERTRGAMLLGLAAAVSTEEAVRSLLMTLRGLAQREADPLLPLGPLTALEERVSVVPSVGVGTLWSMHGDVSMALRGVEGEQPFRMGAAATNVNLDHSVHFRRVRVGRSFYQIAQTTRARSDLSNSPAVSLQPVMAVKMTDGRVAVAPLAEARAFLEARGVAASEVPSLRVL
jgi:hypothetical protein